MTPPNTPVVGVFRNTHFVPSEPFITDQATRLTRYAPVLLARDAFTTKDLPGHALASESAIAGLAYRAGFRPAMGLLVRKVKPDLIHAHFGVDGWGISAAAKNAGVPLVVTLHGFDVTLTDDQFRRSLKPAWRLYYRGRRQLLADPRTRFVAVSTFVARRAVELGADPERVHVLPTGVDTLQLLPSALPAEPKIVHVARLVEVKGTAVLLHAMALLVVRVPDAHLTIVGDGPLRGALQALTATLRLERNVTFLGALSHVRTLAEVSSARVLCLPSIRAANGAVEGLGQVSLEAMALGRVVVASDSGGISEVVDDQHTGLLVPAADVAKMAEALERAVISAEAQTLATAGRKRAEQHFDTGRQSAKLELIYDRALEGRFHG